VLGLRIYVSTIACFTSETGGFDFSPNPYFVEFIESVLNLSDEARLVLESGLKVRTFLGFFFFVGLLLT